MGNDGMDKKYKLKTLAQFYMAAAYSSPDMVKMLLERQSLIDNDKFEEIVLSLFKREVLLGNVLNAMRLNKHVRIDSSNSTMMVDNQDFGKSLGRHEWDELWETADMIQKISADVIEYLTNLPLGGRD